MRKHFFFNLFEDDYFQSNQLLIKDSTNDLTMNLTIATTNNLIKNLSDFKFPFNNFHNYLDSSFSIIYLTILIITCIEILIGNSLLLYTVFSNKLFGNKFTTNYVVTSLAISDLLIGLLIMPYYIFVVRFYGIRNSNKLLWHYELWANLDASLTTASIYSLCLVTLDRYLAVTRPLQYTRKVSSKKVKYCIVIIWILSILTTFLSSILMCILNILIEDDDQRAISKHQIESNYYFHLVLTILTFYLPFFLILFFNVSTYFKVKNHLKDKKIKIKRIENYKTSSQRLLIQNNNLNQSNHTTITSQSDQQLNKNLKDNSSNNSSNNSPSNSKLCLNCFTNQNYISMISGNQVDLNNNLKKKYNNNRRCSLCSCQMYRNLKRESLSSVPYNNSYHFSITKQTPLNGLINSVTWKTFHKKFIEKIQQKHKEGLTRNYTFAFKEFKLIKLLITINLCFSLCWLPIYIYQELLRFNFVKVDNHLLNYLLFLGWLNSGIDPIIYLHLSKKIRKEIKQKLFCFK